MKLFGLKQKSKKGYLGIDLGVAGIKVVQLQKSALGGKLFTYGFSERAPEESGKDYLEAAQETGALLKEVCSRARTTTAVAVGALPVHAVFSSVISIAPSPQRELRQAVEREAQKLIPLPLDEVILDFKMVQAAQETEKTVAVLITAAPKRIVEQYLQIAKSAGIAFGSLETEAFALIRALLGNDPTATVILDMGAVRSNILFVDRGIPVLTRSVNIGGKQCTEAIARSLNVSLEQAEAIKLDLGNVPLPGASPSVLPPPLKEALRPLVNELNYSFGVYRASNKSVRLPERIILTGGGSGLSGLPEAFSAEFNTRTFVGNPWERVDAHPDLQSLLQSLGSRFAVAIGLALRNL